MKKLDISQILLIGYLIRLLIFGSSIGDAIALAALAGLFAFTHYLSYQKQPEINAVVQANLEKVSKELEDVKNTVNAIKVGTQLRGR